MTKRLVVAFAVCVVALICLPAFAATANVSIKNIQYNPSTITVKFGDKVTWTNNDTSTGHSVTADDGSFNSTKAGQTCSPSVMSGCMAPGDRFSVSFNKAGTFLYHCTVHSSMHGKVIVEPKAATPTPKVTLPPKTATPTAKPTVAPVARTAAPTTAPPSPTATATPVATLGAAVSPIGSPFSSPIAFGTTTKSNRGPLIGIAIAAVALAAAGGALLFFRTRGTRP